MFQSLIGIIGNCDVIGAAGALGVLVFQSLIGIIGNCDAITFTGLALRLLFQSLIGIIGNCDQTRPNYLHSTDLVSIPDRDYR